MSDARGASRSHTAIEVVGAEKRFGRSVALTGLDLRIDQGRTAVVLGPNGAGKSTLLRLLAGLARPSAGSVEVMGGVAGLPAVRARVGYVGHATLLAPSLTVRENLVYAARLMGVPRPSERADALLAEDELEALADRPAAALSRGQAQRAAIARGLVHDPPVVLLDEPFAGLDRAAAERLARRLAALAHPPSEDDPGSVRRTMVWVTHDLESVRRVVQPSDGVHGLVLCQGRPLWQGNDVAPYDEVEQALADALERGERAA